MANPSARKHTMRPRSARCGLDYLWCPRHPRSHLWGGYMVPHKIQSPIFFLNPWTHGVIYRGHHTRGGGMPPPNDRPREHFDPDQSSRGGSFRGGDTMPPCRPPCCTSPPPEKNFIWRRSRPIKFWPVFQREIFGPPLLYPPPRVVPPPGFSAKRGGVKGVQQGGGMGLKKAKLPLTTGPSKNFLPAFGRTGH